MSTPMSECDEMDNGENEDAPYFQIIGRQRNVSGVRRGAGTQSQSREELRQTSGFTTSTVYQEILGRYEGNYCWYRVERREDEEEMGGGNIFSEASKADDKQKQTAAFFEKTSSWMQKFVNSAKQQSDTRSSQPLEEMSPDMSPRATEGAVDKTGITSFELPSNDREEKLFERPRPERLKRAKPGPKNSSRLESSRTTTGRRAVIQETLQKFQDLMEMMESEVDSGGESKRRRVDMKVAARMRELKLSLDDDIIGEVEGVEVGDGFNWRAEMSVIGLHKELIAGIHVLKRPESEGGPIATSIVFSVSSSYSDNIYRENKPSIYSGEGGIPSTRGSSTDRALGYQDQTLTGGNLALKRSADQEVPIRVIKGLKRVNKDDKRYVYDGLYEIVSYRYETGVHGNKVYKFMLSKLRRD